MHATLSRRQLLRHVCRAAAVIAIGGGLLVAGAGCSSPATHQATTTSESVTGKTTSTSLTSKTTGASKATATTESSSTTNPGQKVAYLTFDDGPSKLTPELLQTLSDNDVTATFFVVGQNAEEYPGTLKQIQSYGNVLGVHSWTHDYSVIYQSTDAFTEDFNKLKDYIQEETGVAPEVCRFPGGTNNTVCFQYSEGHIMKELVDLVADMGFTYFDWNVSSAEASSPPPSMEQVIDNVVSQCADKKAAVILFHDVDNQEFVDAIPVVISQLRSMGFAFETLSRDNPPESKRGLVQFKPS